MITSAKLIEYKKYNGDPDQYSRSGRKIIESGDWSDIDSLLQDFMLIQSDLTSEGFRNATIARANQLCDCEDTIKQLRRMALTE